jgi:hypothetical protein
MKRRLNIIPMKRLTIFTLIFLASFSSECKACADYYPFGDGARFSILNAHCFNFQGYDPFFYSVHLFAPSFYDSLYTDRAGDITIVERSNIELWRKRCKNIPSERSIYDAIYGNDAMRDAHSTNSFVQYLTLQKDSEAIAYLDFAKHISGLSDFVADPWERNRNTLDPVRRRRVALSLKQARTVKDKDISLRYAFLAIRTAYYNNQPGVIEDVYNEFFAARDKKNIIDYWAMYFRAITEPHPATSNYLSAQVFLHAPDKRFMISQLYHKRVPVADVLQLAKTNEEKAAIWFLSGLQNPGRALESMKHMYTLNVHREELDFLLLREINKLEDWIYTPYYTNYAPSIQKERGGENYASHFKRTKRIKSDRAYAAQLLNFVEAGISEKKSKSLVWKTAQVYLLLMIENDSAALREITVLKNMQPDKRIGEQVQLLEAMCLASIQPDSNAIIPGAIKPLLREQVTKKNFRFIFAIARELEFKGNTTDAAMLLSKINPRPTDWNTFDMEKVIAWQRRNAKLSWYSYTFSEYFDYMDATYSPAQVKELISSCEHFTEHDDFESWKRTEILKDLPRLYDLLGTKYMRINELHLALSSFRKVNDTLWSSKHAPFAQYLDANPFYANFYSGHRKTKGDSIRFTKVSLTKTLIHYRALAEDTNNADRDYYYFLVANCYLNMTYHGNSWIMKRYWSSSYRQDVEYAGGDDYFCCNYAKQYYLKAKAVSKKKKFAALCLRMAGRCEKYRLEFNLPERDYSYDESKRWEKVFDANIYYKQIKKQYPGDYDDLISNCYSFEEYFKRRR